MSHEKPNTEMQQIAQPISLILIKPSPLISLTHKSKYKTHFQNPIISAKWGKKRSGSHRSHKLIINSIAYVASTFKILPEPLDSIVRDFCLLGGGNGGKIGFKTGFGGGGGGRNRKSDKLGFWLLLLISSSLALWVVLEREFDNQLVFWVFMVLVSAFAVYCLVKGWRREIKNWVLRFSCGAALMGFGLRNNENFVRLVDEFRVNSLNFSIIKKKRRKGRRWV